MPSSVISAQKHLFLNLNWKNTWTRIQEPNLSFAINAGKVFKMIQTGETILKMHIKTQRTFLLHIGTKCLPVIFVKRILCLTTRGKDTWRDIILKMMLRCNKYSRFPKCCLELMDFINLIFIYSNIENFAVNKPKRQTVNQYVVRVNKKIMSNKSYSKCSVKY